MKNRLNLFIKKTQKSIKTFPIYWIAFVFTFCSLLYSLFTLEEIDKKSAEVIGLSIDFSEYLNLVSLHDYNMQMGNLNNDETTKINTLLDKIKNRVKNLDDSSPGTIEDDLNERLKERVQWLKSEQSNIDNIFKENGNENNGLQNALRIDAHNLDPDTLVEKRRLYPVIDSIPFATKWIHNYGELRRNEKDFLLRSRDSQEVDFYAFKVTSRITSFRNLLKTVDSIYRSNYQQVLNSYEKNFNTLHEGIKKRNSSKSSIDRSRDDFKNQISSVNKSIQDRIIVFSSVNSKALRYVLYFLGLIGSCILIAQLNYINRNNEKLNNNIQKIAYKVLNFREYKTMMHDIWRDLKDILKLKNDSKFLLYKYDPENKRLKIYYDDEVDTINPKNKIKIDYRSTELDNTLSVNIFNNPKSKKITVIEESDDTENNLFAGRNSQIYRLLTSSTNARLGLISLQSSKKHHFNKKEEQIIDRIAKFFESSIETDNILDGLKNIILDINPSLPLKELVEKIYPNLLLIFNHQITIAVGVKTKESIKFIGKSDPEEPCYESEDYFSDQKTYPSIYCIKKNEPLFYDNNQELKNKFNSLPPLESFNKMQSFIYLPINIEDEVIGLITLQSEKQNAFNQKYFDLLGIITSAMSIYFSSNTINMVEIANSIKNSIQLSANDRLDTAILKGDIKTALEILLEISKTEDVILLSAQFNHLKFLHERGTISSQEYLIRANNILSALCSITNSK